MRSLDVQAFHKLNELSPIPFRVKKSNNLK